MNTSRLILLLTTVGYVAVFSWYYISIGNYEFLWYVGVMLGFIVLITATIKQTDFSTPLLMALSFWGFLHMAGGGIVIDGHVLYSQMLIPLVSKGELLIFKFDQLVHFYGFAVATFAMYHLLQPLVQKGVSKNRVLFLVFLAGMGLGALNEIVEFIAVVVFPNTNVGGYYNTGLDLVFNALGALTMVLLIRIYNHSV